MPVVSHSCYELLGVPLRADLGTLRGAWRDRRSEAELRLGELAAEEVEAICARVDEAFRILSDPVSSRRYSQYQRQFTDDEVTEPELPAAGGEFEWSDPDDALAVTDPSAAAAGQEASALALLGHVIRDAPNPGDAPPWHQPEAPARRGLVRLPGLVSRPAPSLPAPSDPARGARATPPWVR